MAPSFGLPSRSGSVAGAPSGGPGVGLGMGSGPGGPAARMWKNELKDREEGELQELALEKARILERIAEARRMGMLKWDLDSLRQSPSTGVGADGSRSASRSGSVVAGDGAGAGATAEDVEGRGKEPRDNWDFVIRDVKAAYKRRLADSAATRAFAGHGSGAGSGGSFSAGNAGAAGAGAGVMVGYGGVGPYVAGSVAAKVRMHWEAVAAKEEKKRAELEKEWRSRWKVAMKVMINEWKKAVLVRVNFSFLLFLNSIPARLPVQFRPYLSVSVADFGGVGNSISVEKNKRSGRQRRRGEAKSTWMRFWISPG